MGATVVGIDLSMNMLDIGRDRLSKLPAHIQEKVSLEFGDITEQTYTPGSFDVIYSRDTILHIANKQQLFSLFHSWLAPGGSLLITDYCQGDKVLSSTFLAYVKQREYNLTTVKQYGNLIEKAGFIDVQATDYTEGFIQILRRELDRFQNKKEAFLKEFAMEHYTAIVDGWTSKVGRSAFYMAEKYGATVVGIDLSMNMLDIGRDRLSKLPSHIQEKVSLEFGDITEQT